jgi:hypothetical protein
MLSVDTYADSEPVFVGGGTREEGRCATPTLGGPHRMGSAIRFYRTT